MTPQTPQPAPWPAWTALAITLLLVFCWAAGPNTTNDLYWHVETGRVVAQLDGFPDRDPFSFTANDQRWFLHEWLTQLTFFGLHEVGGLHALRLFTGLAAVGILLLVFGLWRRRLGASAAVLGVLLFLVLGAGRFQTRPTLFSIALFVGLVGCLADAAPRWTWRGRVAVVLATLCWVNLHSVGLLAVVLLATTVLGEATKLVWRRPLGVTTTGRDVRAHAAMLAAAFAVSLLNPAGLDLYAFAFQDKSAVMQFVADEWAPFHLLYSHNEELTFPAYVAILTVLGLLLGTYLAAGVALSRDRTATLSSGALDPTRILLLLLCVALGLAARRFNWMLAVAAALALTSVRQMAEAGVLGTWYRRPARLALPAALALQLALLVVVYQREMRHLGAPLHTAMTSADYYTDGDCKAFQLGGVRFMKERGLRGNAFCHYGSGGILSYHLYPDIKVFIDSRIDLYRRGVYLDYLAVASGRPDQNAILARHGTDIFYRHWNLAPLADRTGWVQVYAGADGEVLIRDDTRNRENLARCGVAAPR